MKNNERNDEAPLINPGAHISATEALEMIAEFLNARPRASVKYHAIVFTKAQLQELMNQNNVEAVRFYFAYNKPDEHYSLCAVAVDALGNDMLRALGTTGANMILNRGTPCPPDCPKKPPKKPAIMLSDLEV